MHGTVIGENNGIASGFVRIGKFRHCASESCIRLGAILNDDDYIGDKGVVRAVDLSNATQATLSYDYKRRGGSAGSVSVRVKASNDSGVSWSNITTHTINSKDNSQQKVSFALEDILTLSANTLIRFVASGEYPKDQFRTFLMALLKFKWVSN